MRYGVGYDQSSGIIEAGPVRATGDDEAFIMRSDVTGQALGAVAEWLVANMAPFRVTDAAGNVYQIAAKESAMTIYTYDCEFLENGSTIELISIGICCEDGREYYAVNSEMPYDQMRNEPWLIENVVPSLPLNGKIYAGGFGDRPSWAIDMRSTLVKPKWVIRNEIREFLLTQGKPELWAYYGAYDHVALAQFWGKMIYLPKGMPMWTHELMQLIEGIPDFELPEQLLGEHHALEDARWNMKVYRKAVEK